MTFPPPPPLPTPPPPPLPGHTQPPRKSSWLPLVIVGLIGVITIVAGLAAVVIVVMMNRGVFTPPMADTPSVAEAPPTAPPEVPPSREPEAEAETPEPSPARVPEPATPEAPPEREGEAPEAAPGEPRAPADRTRPRGEGVSRDGDGRGEAARGRQPLRIGGEIPRPTKLRDVKPIYPPIAVAARVQGVVIIEATIDPDGKVSEARVLRSIPLLDQAALEAVRQWEYTPTLLNGEAVPVIMTVTANFTLR
jgi:periplasmic protein TonB